MYSIATLKTYSWLLWRDVREVRKVLKSKAIDSFIWPISNVLVSGYILTAMGMPSGYGIFMLVGSVIAICIWDSSADATNLAGDLSSGERLISYELTLPLTYWLVYLRIASTFAIKAMAFNLLTIPIGLVFISNEFSYLNISLIKLLLSYVISNLFIASFTTFTVVNSKDVASFNRFWMRYGSLLFMFSGYQFSWTTLKGIYPVVAKISLLNPFVYTFESMRIALMGQAGNAINFWYCMLALIGFSIIFLYVGIKLFKKRLDCI